MPTCFLLSLNHNELLMVNRFSGTALFDPFLTSNVKRTSDEKSRY
jgi:hypothetical protein